MTSHRPAPADLDALEQAVLGEAGAAHRDLFINTLFAQSVEAYRQVLLQLQGTSGWNEASTIIAERVFRPFQVDIYSDAALRFTDAVESQHAARQT